MIDNTTYTTYSLVENRSIEPYLSMYKFCTHKNLKILMNFLTLFLNRFFHEMLYGVL